MSRRPAPERVQAGRAVPDQGEGTGEGASAAPPRRYGCWAGDPKGSPEDLTRCREEVWPSGRSMIPHQCRRPRGHGEDGAYCSVHAKDTKDIKPFSCEPRRRK